MFFTGSAWSASGVEISLSDKDINLGLFSSTLFEDTDKEDERYGDVYAHLNFLIADQGNRNVLDGIIEVSRQIPLENSRFAFGVGLRPLYARFERNDRDQDVVALQLGGKGGYDFSVGEEIDIYIQGSIYFAPKILTFSNQFASVVYANFQVGIYVIANTAFYIEYESEEVEAEEGENVEIVNGVLFGLRIGF